MTGEAKQDDSIIELTDVVEDGEEVENTLSDDILSEDEISDDNPIELTDLEDFSDIEMDLEEIEMEDSARDVGSGEEEPVFEKTVAPEETSSSEEMPAPEETPVSEERSVPEELSVSEEQIEAALERVIEKKFADQIEPLLFDTMERVIQQEIQKIKTALLKDMDRIGPF